MWLQEFIQKGQVVNVAEPENFREEGAGQRRKQLPSRPGTKKARNSPN